jgi:hypothetical protein
VIGLIALDLPLSTPANAISTPVRGGKSPGLAALKRI